LILAPTQRQIAGEVQDSEEIDYAIAELLVPQTSLLTDVTHKHIKPDIYGR